MKSELLKRYKEYNLLDSRKLSFKQCASCDLNFKTLISTSYMFLMMFISFYSIGIGYLYCAIGLISQNKKNWK